MTSSEIIKGLCKWWTLEEPELVQLDKLLHAAGKPMTGLIITENLTVCVLHIILSSVSCLSTLSHNW